MLGTIYLCIFRSSLPCSQSWAHIHKTQPQVCTVSQVIFPQQLICMSCGLDRHLKKDGVFWINRNELWSVLKCFFVLAFWLISHEF